MVVTAVVTAYEPPKTGLESAMARHLLDAKTCANARPRAKPYRLADGDALYLYVSPTGAKSWQYRYRHHGRQQTATLGKYSSFQALAWARHAVVALRSKAAEGEQLTQVKRLAKAAKRATASNTFAALATDWIKSEARRSTWTAGHRAQVKASLNKHLSGLDALPIGKITAEIAMPLVRRVEGESPEMGRKVRRRLRAIFDYAMEGGLMMGNPIPASRRRKTATERKHLPAITERDGVRAILQAAAGAKVSNGVTRAHLLLTFTAQRVGEVVGATWSEFDLDAAVWAIPRERMKKKDAERGPHQVPIPPRLVVMLRKWKAVDGTGAHYVMPAVSGEGFITREAVEKFYRQTLKLRGKHSPHSWRSVFSTWANDAGHDANVIEAQLDHVTGSKVATAYDRAQRFNLRVPLMEWYESQLIAARDGAKVVELKRRLPRR
jgi:integrase